MLDSADEMRAYLCGARALIPFPGLGRSVPRWLFSHGELTLLNASLGGTKSLKGNFFLTFYFVLGYSRLNPLQCSCLENPRDGGAWWAAVYGVAQSQTRLKRLSSSSSMSLEKARTK